MADREPPPIEDDGIKEEDDLFSDVNEIKSLPASHPIEERKSKPEEKTGILTNINIVSDKDDDDIFLGGETKVRLDSDSDDGGDDNAAGGISAKSTTPAPGLIMEKEDDVPEIEPLPAQDERPKLNFTQIASEESAKQLTSKRTLLKGSKEFKDDDTVEEDPHTIAIKVVEPQKIGDGMSAYIVYKVITETTFPAFRKGELIVIRRFSDFLGLYEKLREKYAHYGRIVPPAPEKSLVGMTKVKMLKEESDSVDFLEGRRAALERYLNRTANHPVLKMDPDLREFLEKDGELPKATNTSAFSGAGVKRLLSRVGDAVEKITFKMDESDEWFELKGQQIENLDQQLKKLHSAMESLVNHRQELAVSTVIFAKSTAMLGTAEEHAALSRALSQLAETEEKIEQLHKEQSEQDLCVMVELLKDYIALLGSVKDVFHERVKSYKNWKDAEATLAKKREIKAKLELAHKTDKISQAQQEITDWDQRVEKCERDFESLSATIRKEVLRFDKLRATDFKTSIIQYLENLMEKQQQIIKHWEHFLPEAKAIV